MNSTRTESEQTLREATAKAEAAGFRPDENGWWPDAAFPFFDDRRLVQYWRRGEAFKIEARDWWDDASFLQHVHGVEPAGDDPEREDGGYLPGPVS